MVPIYIGTSDMDGNALTFADLKAQHRKIRDGLPENLSLRIHRALSWLNCADITGLGLVRKLLSIKNQYDGQRCRYG